MSPTRSIYSNQSNNDSSSTISSITSASMASSNGSNNIFDIEHLRGKNRLLLEDFMNLKVDDQITILIPKNNEEFCARYSDIFSDKDLKFEEVSFGSTASDSYIVFHGYVRSAPGNKKLLKSSSIICHKIF